MDKANGKFPWRGDDSTPSRDPKMAAALSLVPGLGQFYNGQSARGFLFFDVALVNFVILWLMLFTEPITRALSAFSTEFHIKPNQDLLHALQQMHIGTPVSSAVLLLILGFVGYAARDAYDQAKAKRLQAIYSDHAIEMPEATSGSYLLHLSMIVTCAVLALFFILPPPPRTQVTDIEFIETTHQTKPPVHANKFSNHSSNTDARRDPTRAVAEAHAASQQATHPAQQRTAQLHPAETRPAQVTPPRTAQSSTQPAPQPTQAATAAAASTPPAFHPHLVNTMARSVVSPAVPTPHLQAQAHANSAPMPMPIATAGASGPAVPLPQPLAKGPGGEGHPMPSAQPLLAMAGVGHAPSPRNSVTPGDTNLTGPVAPGPMAHTGKPDIGSPQPQPASTHGPVGPGIDKGQQTPAPMRGGPLVGPGGVIGTPILPRGDGPGPGPGPKVMEVNFGPYMAMLQRRIKMHWIPPKYPTSNHVQVRFKVSRTGELSDLKMIRSSGQSEADRFAMKAIEDSAPFPPLPQGADENVDIEFTFDYNVFGTGNSFHRF